MSSAFGHESIKSARKSVRDDLELRWVTNLSEERKRFYLIATLLDPRTKLLSFCDNKYFPSSWKDEGHVFLSMEFKSFYMEHTQGEVNDAEAQVPKPSVLDDLLGVSSTSMDVDPYLSLEHTNIYSVDCRLTVPHTCQSLPTINQLLISTVY